MLYICHSNQRQCIKMKTIQKERRKSGQHYKKVSRQTCKHCSSDGKDSWLLGAKEQHKVTLKHSHLQLCSRERFLQCNTCAPAGGVSPAKFLPFCTSPLWLREMGKVVTSLLRYIPPKEGLTQTSSKRFIGREESRRAAASARVKKGSSQLSRYRAYIGLLRDRVFPG